MSSRMGHWIDHTPMCPRDCLVKHHELVLALSSSSMSTAELDCCIQVQVKRGWDVDSDIPDPLPNLQRPILYLAASFCFIRVLRYLLERFQLKAAVQSSKGESALHGMIKHAYHTLRTSRPDCRRKIEAVTKMLQTLTNHDPKILLVKDYTDNQTPLLFTAQLFVDLENTSSDSRRKRIPPQENFYAGCIEAILQNISYLYEKGNISKDELSEALITSDSKGCNVLHVLAQSTHEKARNIFRRVVDLMNVVSSKTDVLFLKNNAGKTVTDLVLEHRPQHATAWLSKLDYEDEGPPTMVDMHPLKQDSYDDADSATATNDTWNSSLQMATDPLTVETDENSSEWASSASNTVTVHPSLPHTEVVYCRSPVFIAGSSHINDSSELHTTTASPTELMKEKYNQTISSENVVGTSLKSVYEKQPASSTEESNNSEQNDAFLSLIMHDNYGLDSAGQIGMLDILQQGLKRKLSQVEDTMKATDEEIESFEETVKSENNEMRELECRLAELKQVLSKHSAVIKEKRRKLKSLSMDELKLRKKIQSCEEARKEIACKSCKKEIQES